MTQVHLGKQIGLSEPALSKIVNGKVKPRPITVTKLIHVLCHTKEEYQNIIACYEGGAEKLKEIPEFLEWKPDAKDEQARAQRYLQVKAESIRFAKAVEEKLRETGLPFERDVFANDLVADFVVSGPSGKVIIECKYNVNRDWDRTVATVRLLKANFTCDRVVVVVPHRTKTVKEAKGEVKRAAGCVIPLENLKELLQ